MSALGEYHEFKKIFRDLQKHVNAGLKLYQSRRTDIDSKFRDLFESLDAILEPLQEHQRKIGERASEFDFILVDGTHVKANGYRSLLYMLNCLLMQLHQILQKCTKERSSRFFLPTDHISNITAYCRALEGMEVILGQAVILMDVSPSNQLFNDGEMSLSLRRLASSEYISRDVFYGRCLGFQYTNNLKPVIKMLAIAMASYERWYKAEKDNPLRQLFQSLWKGSKYIHNPTQMGLKLDDLTQLSSVYFVKAFWSILEQDAVKTTLNLISQSVEISQTLEVPAKNITLKGTKGEVTITPPFSEELGYRPIPLLLVSHKWRQGQDRGYPSKKQPLPPSTGLIVHIHGGGFVAQSPKSHEFYLRSWSQELQTPVVSIEYSLAPEAPFPRPWNECVMSYAWILKNLDKLGTTGENIVLVGDSAGGNFCMGTAMKILEYGLRLPDRIVICYPTLISTSSVSPSRFISVFDPILPIGVMLSCQQAYAGCPPSNEDVRERKELRKKILKAKGIYPPEPDMKDAVSPAPLRKQGSKDKCDSKPPKKVPPPRPEPPTVSFTPSMQSQARRDSSLSQEDKDEMDNGRQDCSGVVSASNGLFDVDLTSNDSVPVPGGSEEVLDTEESMSNGSDEPMEEDQVSQAERRSGKKTLFHQTTPSLLYCRRDPADEDRLSEVELERMIQELLKAFQEPDITRDPYMSPGIAPGEMLIGLPPVHIIGTSLDPLLDDSIAMAQKLQSVNQPVTLNVIENVPHGFLCFRSAGNDQDLEGGQKLCVSYIKQGLSIP